MITRKAKISYLGKSLYNDTDIFVIVDINTRIVVSEFIATDFVDYFCKSNNITFGDYLQLRKKQICNSLGLNSNYFGVSYKNYGYETYNSYLMCVE